MRRIIKAFIILFKQGPNALLDKIKDRLRQRNQYKYYLHLQEKSDNKDVKIKELKAFQYKPLISIIVPVYNTEGKWLRACIQSVLNQIYDNWELCIADGGSTKHHIKEILKKYAMQDSRIKVKFLSENKGIAGNSNEALSLATGEFICLLDHDDELSPDALFEVVKLLNEKPDIDFIYTDEDKITVKGKRIDPHFKPDWSPDTLRSYNYITHLSIFKKELLDKIGYFREDFDGSQDYDIILRATEQAKYIVHIPKVLYHWRASINSVAGNAYSKMYAYKSAKKALNAHLFRTGTRGKVEDGQFLGSYRIVYEIEGNPKASIIIPNNDHIEILKKCISSILKKTAYKNYEIIIIENNSVEQETFKYYEEISKFDNIKVIKWDNPFSYSAVNNFAVNYAQGDILIFLNNDIQIDSSSWLKNMLEHAIKKEVGVVGAKLYYPDNTIQHAGLILGMGKHRVAGHHHYRFPGDSFGFWGRLQVIQNLSAVTGACMMLRKEVFEEVKGFDEGFQLAYNDVDLCIRIREKGYLIVWTPYAELYHHESKSRGYENTLEKQERFEREVEYFHKKWQHILDKGDLYYNPNLTLDREDFSIKL